MKMVRRNEDAAFQLDQEWFHYICNGHRDAAEFLGMFFTVCHLWDDLIDKDVERSNDHINHAFWIAFIDSPRNKYYRTFHAEIMPLMAVSMQEWFTANQLEAGNRQDIAYTLRCSIVSLIHQAAEICGGYEWALKVGEEIRLKTQNQTLDEYSAELDA